ncbi:MAG: hypothetical protein J5698_01190 [Bacteroidaceae bacterium]|nr:hypothetical protein [Bacteroidaceae bacterium]
MEEMELPKSWEEACQKRAEAVKRMQQHPLSWEEAKAQCDRVMAPYQPLKNSQEEHKKED